MTLTETQLALLSSAAQGEHRLLVLSPTLKGGAAQKVVSKLLAGGLVQEVPVSPDQPRWRMSEDGAPVGLALTEAGLCAILAEPSEAQPDPCETDAQDEVKPDQPASAPSTPAQDRRGLHASRPGSKQALVLDLLSRAEGATIDELTGATGWLPHTTRAALTGLRKSGHAISRSKRESGETVYRIVVASGDGTPEPESSQKSAAAPAEA